MVMFKVKANQSGQYYFPKEVRQELGDKLTLICNTKVAIVFSDDAMLQNVLESIEIIINDLKHRLQLQKEGELRHRLVLQNKSKSSAPEPSI